MTVSTFGKTKLSRGKATMIFYANLYQSLQPYRLHKHQYEQKIEILIELLNRKK